MSNANRHVQSHNSNLLSLISVHEDKITDTFEDRFENLFTKREDNIKEQFEDMLITKENLLVFKNEVLNGVKDMDRTAQHNFKDIISENYNYKDKDFDQRADNKEDLRKEGQVSTSNTSALFQNKSPIAGASSFPQYTNAYGH